jgi:hypothetical protein
METKAHMVAAPVAPAVRAAAPTETVIMHSPIQAEAVVVGYTGVKLRVVVALMV